MNQMKVMRPQLVTDNHAAARSETAGQVGSGCGQLGRTQVVGRRVDQIAGK
jgi:hypothetical protein